MSRLKKGALISGVGAMAIGIVGSFEGLRTKSYSDIVGVWTACYGETRNIRPGMTFTKPECDRMLADRLVEFETNMRACLKAPDSIPDKPYVAFVSLSYNIGSRAFCGSSVAKKANAGDLRGACDAILLWNRAGGKEIPGLTRRRQEERALCLGGV